MFLVFPQLSLRLGRSKLPVVEEKIPSLGLWLHFIAIWNSGHLQLSIHTVFDQECDFQFQNQEIRRPEAKTIREISKLFDFPYHALCAQTASLVILIYSGTFSVFPS